MKHSHRPAWLLATALPALLAAMPALAQTQPDAGQTLQELQPAPQLPAPSPDLPLQPPTAPAPAPGGATVVLQSVEIAGNSIFDTATLQTLLADAIGGAFDLAGLNALADRLSVFYRANDYPFARAFVPAQSVENGNLRIEIVEGRYGKIEIVGEDRRAAQAQGYLVPLEPGTAITGSDIERIALILDDQPGYKFTPVIRPGDAVGEGDLLFKMERDSWFGGRIRADNHGNRYTGAYRGQIDLHVDSPLMLGDQLTLSGIYTDEDLWLGAVGYGAPIGSSGLRGTINYVHTYYELGKSYADLDAHGTADVLSAGLSYPIVRSQDANLTVLLNYQHKWLTDRQDSDDLIGRKESDSVPLTLAFDLRDSLLGGGVTYGALGITNGVMDLKGDLRAEDREAGNTDGYFLRGNLDVARLQATPVENLLLFGRAAGQFAGHNLDSSEEFGLGGVNGVRAYPAGEAYGDAGWLVQMEVRYTIDTLAPVSFTPYAFYDHGGSWTDQDPWESGDNYRDIGGAGIGLRFQWQGLQADALAAWRTSGGRPQSDSKDGTPLFWASIGYEF